MDNGTLTVRIGKGQMKEIQRIARLELRSLSDIVREFIDTGLERRDADLRNSLPVGLCKKSST
jgi:hypothetical protein